MVATRRTASIFPVVTKQARLRSSLCPFRLQRRWAVVQDVRFIVTRTKSNLVWEKYQGKLDRKAKEEGYPSVDSLKDGYREKALEERKRAQLATAPASLHSIPTSCGPHASVPRPMPRTAVTGTSPSPSAIPIKPLSAFLDLSKVSALPPKELEYIWRLRHASDPLSLCAVIPISTYGRIYQAAKRHPQFVLPLPRPSATGPSWDINSSSKDPDSRRAADVHFLQWGFHPPTQSPVPGTKTSNTHTSTVIFTNLASFKSHGTHAQPHTAVTHYLDLADSHGLVLLKGDVTDGGGVSAEEARWLLMCLQKFYDQRFHDSATDKPSTQRLLESFSDGDEAFSLGDLMEAAETFSR